MLNWAAMNANHAELQNEFFLTTVGFKPKNLKSGFGRATEMYLVFYGGFAYVSKWPLYIHCVNNQKHW